MAKEDETLRWPVNLDRGGIESRLAEVRLAAQSRELGYLVSLFEGIERMSAAQLGANVVAALTWLQDRPEHRAITTKLEMVALNLKNLK